MYVCMYAKVIKVAGWLPTTLPLLPGGYLGLRVKPIGGGTVWDSFVTCYEGNKTTSFMFKWLLYSNSAKETSLETCATRKSEPRSSKVNDLT